MNLPTSLMTSLHNVPGFDKKSFESIHQSGEQVTAIRINPAKWPAVSNSGSLNHLAIKEKVAWSSFGYYLAERPSFTLDPFFHAGCYYVQDASSMFVEQAFKQSVDATESLRVLDLCGAPGGKSTLLLSLLNANSLLVTNEVIRSRASVLEENIIKWGLPNVIVTNTDPKNFQRLEEYFDVIVIDAPCSGSGLFRKDPEAIGEWSEENVQLCCQRQKRILADILPAIKKNGVMVYSTCSYSEEENESIIDWMLDEFPVKSMQLDINDEWGIVESISKKHAGFGYRFYPDKVKGEGFFLACLKRLGSDADDQSFKKSRQSKTSKNEEKLLKPWLNIADPYSFFKHENAFFAFPTSLEEGLNAVMGADIYIKNAGVRIGTLAREELIPDHSLAVSTIISQEIPSITLKKQEALQYLRKEEVKIASGMKGWNLVKYEGVNLGWIKQLNNRSNNYYPKEWRILKSGKE